ncbi:MAG: hypothetical protein Q6361_00910 [Candidatus Hermodarchaeota archaeon]|nr:hypothetical protein [Candidatus Hermodarchaeota archaeon]
MDFDVPFEKVKAALQKNLLIVANAEARTIRLEFKGTLYQDMPFMDILDDEEGLKRMARNFIDEDITYTAEPLPEGQGILLRFDTYEAYLKMYDFLDGLVNGDLLKELISQVMKSMFSAMDDDGSEFDNTT